MGKKHKLLAGVVLMLILFVSVAGNCQEKFPIRPIEMVCTWGPGGGSDIFARKAAHIAEKYLAQPKTRFSRWKEVISL